MYYSQATIDNLLGEHVAIRGQLELVTGLTREWKLLLTLQESILQSQDKLQAVTEKRASLTQAMGYLADGLRNHHIHEDEVLPSLIGSLLMKAIRIEHAEMLKLLERIDSLITNTGIEAFLRQGAEIMQLIDNLGRLAAAHSVKEDGILRFLKKLPELK